MTSMSRQRRDGSSRGGATREQARSTRDRRSNSTRTRTAASPSRLRALRRRWVAGLSLVTVLALAYVLLFTSLLGVDSVRVEGADSVSATRVRDTASVEHGKPLLRVDTAAIKGRVDTLSALSGAKVSRSWPSTVVISVTERTPVVALGTSQGFQLVDRKGVAYHTVDAKPAKLPLLRDVRGSGSREAAVEALAAVPPQLREHVATVSAENKHTVRFTLDDDAEVVWGTADHSERKAKVLAALLTQDGSVYDVSSPDLPTVH